MNRKWFLVALSNLLFATIIGVLLRFAFVEEVFWLKFRYFLHAHSHVAMLGWIYLALYTFIVPNFIKPDAADSRIFNRLFWATELSVLGMLVSFPIQGYGPVSISFSTAHILCSYYFVWKAWPYLRKAPGFATQLLRISLAFMLLSTVALWAMGPIIATGLKGSALYYMAVQFYLHFQFNGWFIFALLALLFKQLDHLELTVSKSLAPIFLKLLVLSCFLTYALAVAWSQPYLIVFVINSVGVILQVLALFYLYRLISPVWPSVVRSYDGISRVLLKIALFCLGFKILTQAAVAVPAVAEAAYTIRNYVIGFIHLILLGVISAFLFALAYKDRVLQEHSRTTRIGIIVFLAGLLLSELILFLQGTMLWGAMGFLPHYYEVLFTISALMPIGVFFTLVGVLLRPTSLIRPYLKP